MAVALGTSAWASAQPRASVCLVRGIDIPGLEPGALDSALELETRKWGVALDQQTAGSTEDCPEPTAESTRVTIEFGPESTVRIRFARGGARSFDLSPTSPLDRARVVAQAVVAAVPGQAPSAPPRIVEDRLLFPLDRPAPRGSMPRRQPVQGYAQVGCSYGYQARPALHVIGAEVEAGAAFFDERLAVGLGVGWQPKRPLEAAAMSASIQSVPAFAMLRGGWKVAPVLFRAGLIAGAEWRQVAYRPPSRLRQRFENSWAMVLGGEIELAFLLTRSFRLAIAAFGRGYIGGASFAWDGLPILDAPGSSFGAAIRFGAVFPRVDSRGN